MKVLVTGATGTVGRQIVTQLVQAGHEVRALTRNPATATLPVGAEVVQGDLALPESLIPALEGVEAVHLINFDNGAGGMQLQNGAELVEMLKQAGVKRVTVLQGGEKSSIEQALEASDLTWTFVQPVEFMANFLEWAEPIRTEGGVKEPFANRRTALVHEADIAAVAATALTQDGHGGKTYTITGPEVLTPPQLLQTIGEGIGQELHFVELTEAQARERWKAQGFSEEFIEFFVWAHGNTPELGYTVAPTVEQVTGHPPRPFAQWVAEHADRFR